eukprot:5639092-Pleurochrysis_carterae.AAC.3
MLVAFSGRPAALGRPLGPPSRNAAHVCARTRLFAAGWSRPRTVAGKRASVGMQLRCTIDYSLVMGPTTP